MKNTLLTLVLALFAVWFATEPSTKVLSASLVNRYKRIENADSLAKDYGRRVFESSREAARAAKLFAGAYHTITVAADGTYWGDRGDIQPGDTVLIGAAQQIQKSIVLRLYGTRALPIVVTSNIGNGLVVGDTAFNGGGSEDGWQIALQLEKSRHVRVWANRPDGRGSFKVVGSKKAARYYYKNVVADDCQDIEFNGIESWFGGTGFWAKAEVDRNDPNSWRSSGRSMGALKLINCKAIGTENEGMYLGYTNDYVELNHVFTNPDGTTFTGYYYVDILPGQPAPNATTHKQALRWTSILVQGCLVDSTGADGIQTASADTVILRNNIVTRHGYYNKDGSNFAHAAGIIIGGRTGGSKGKILAEGNIIRNGWGESLQLFGDGNGAATLAGARTDTLRNNLIDRPNLGLTVAIRGDSGLRFVFANNTIVRSKDHTFRINGRDYGFGVNGMPWKHIFNANIYIEPAGQNYYTENPQFAPHENGVIEGTGSNANLKYATLGAAPVDPNNYYLPTNGATQGYRYNGIAPETNQAPTAFAGANQTITLPTSQVTLNGSGTDDGTVAGYSWSKVSGPAGGAITSPSAQSTTITGLTQGTHTYRLTVTDNQGATGFDDVTVTVNAAPGQNTLPIVNAGPDATFTITLNYTLSGSASDPGGSIASLLWTQVAGPSGISINSQNTAVTTLTGIAVGIYTFRLTATDNQGGVSFDEVTLTVNGETGYRRTYDRTGQVPIKRN